MVALSPEPFQLKTLSLNIRGINQSTKRRKLFRWQHHQRADCYFLQETYSDEKCITSWESEWGGTVYAAHGSKHSKGVLFLINPKFDYQVEKCIKDKNGRFIILDLKVENSHFILVNIYAPNDSTQQVKFLKDLQGLLAPFSGENIIIGGDFNCPLTSADKMGGRSVHFKQNVINEITKLSSLYSLCDVWR